MPDHHRDPAAPAVGSPGKFDAFPTEPPSSAPAPPAGSGESPPTDYTSAGVSPAQETQAPPPARRPPRPGRPARHPLPSGTRVGPYTVLECIGQGGMGIVYRARHHSLSRTAALKMMLLGGSEATPEYLARFRRDADSMAQLEHPHIVKVYDYDHDQVCGPYFALEYVEGGSLAARLKKEPCWDFRRAARLVEALARATHAAHEKGIVHRDLKPANVLLDPLPPEAVGPGGLDFVPKITDFGLAKTCAALGSDATVVADDRLTYLGTVMGTPWYMAPEQAEGRPDVDRRADVFALGAILYELLTGRPPFVGDVSEVLVQVRNYTDPPPVRPYRADVPPALEEVCRKCLRRDPAERYATAAGLADALGAWLGLAPSGGKWPPPEPGRAAWPKRLAGLARRHPARVALAVLAVGLLCAGAYVAARAGSQSQKERETEAARHVAQGEAALKDQDRVGAIGKFADARDDYERLAASYPGRPDYRIRAAELLNKQGKCRYELRDWGNAERTFQEALGELKPLHQSDQSPESHRGLMLQEAEAYHGLGMTYNDRDDTAGGLDALKANWEKARNFFNESKDRRRQLRADARDDDTDLPQIERDLARSYGYLGDTYLKLGQDQIAREVYRRAEEVRERLAGQRPDDLDAQMQLARSYANTAYLRQRLGKPGALDQFQKAREYLRARMDQYRAAVNPPSDFLLDYGDYCNEAASLLMDQPGADRDRVHALLDEARGVYEQPAKDHPDDSSLVSGLAETYLLLGRYHLPSDREAARDALRKADRLLGDPRLRLGPSDLVNRALVAALQAQLADDTGTKRVLLMRADEFLEGAYRTGYNNLGQLRRLAKVPEFEPLGAEAPVRDLIGKLEAEPRE